MLVDLILHNATIYTVDTSFSTAEAVAIQGDRIVAVGTNEEILGAYKAEETRDLQGQFAYPGFIDAHVHLSRYGRSCFEVDLKGAGSWAECMDRMRQQADVQPEGWLIGRGWDQTRWADGQFPDNTLLNEYFPHRPVILERIDIHAIVVNQYLLNLSGITPESEINGGEIRKRDGELTGLLIDHAQKPVWDLLPEPFDDELKKYLRKAAWDCCKVGLTSVGDALLDHKALEAIRSLQNADEFPLRVYGMLPSDDFHRNTYLKAGPQSDLWLHLGAFKLFADGTFGSRSAWLREPYADAPDQCGLLMLDEQETLDWLRECHVHNWQVATHAIGDAAASWVMDLYEKAMDSDNSLRWRIEHLQMLSPHDLDRLGKLKILASIQPAHTTSDMRWIEDRLGVDRKVWAHRQASILEKCGRIALGSDFPVESINPLLGFYAAVTRQDLSGWPQNGYIPEERISRIDALRGMTIWAAYAQGEERQKGSLEPGKLADIVVLDQDLLSAGIEQIPGLNPQQIILGGRVIGSDG